MNFWESIFLGILQGVSEFLPISSSGHLILGEALLGLEVEELKSFDVMVHLGSLLAILIYFRKDIWQLILGLGKLLKGRFNDEYVRLIGYIVVGTIPAVFAGLFLGDFIDSLFRNVAAVAIWMAVIGVVFLIGEKVAKQKEKITIGRAILIGVAQACALIPGVSRSGSTIVTGLFLGMKREKAARFSFLLGIPAIFGAGVLTFKDGLSDFGLVSPSMMAVGFISSAIAGYISIAFLMRFLRTNGLQVFAYYLIFIGILAFSVDKF